MHTGLPNRNLVEGSEVHFMRHWGANIRLTSPRHAVSCEPAQIRHLPDALQRTFLGCLL